jgi:hypothetical protein
MRTLALPFWAALLVGCAIAQSPGGPRADAFRGLILNQTAPADAIRILGQPAADKTDKLDISKVGKWLDPKQKEKIFRQISFRNVGDFSQIQLSFFEDKLIMIDLSFKKNLAPEIASKLFGVEFAAVGTQGGPSDLPSEPGKYPVRFVPTFYPFSYNLIGISDKAFEDLIRAMQVKYAKSWYKTLTFVQQTTEFQADGKTKVSTWYEALSAPGRLRIDFDPIVDGNGILFANNTVYTMKSGKVENSRAFVHSLIVLGFDIYFVPVPQMIDTLKQLKFDLSIIHEDTWEGRPVYVVGAPRGDLHSTQFWIDKKNLYFVRMLRPSGKDGAGTSDVRFNKYQRTKRGAWVAAEVVFLNNGKIATTEEYSDIRTDVALDEKLFDPQYWSNVHWR